MDPERVIAVRDAKGNIVIQQDPQFVNGVLQKLWNMVRQKRDKLLAETDWTQSNDSPLSATSKIAWKEYRTKLRNIPADFSDPRTVVWPTKPQ
jgi:hypothetical protein